MSSLFSAETKLFGGADSGTRVCDAKVLRPGLSFEDCMRSRNAVKWERQTSMVVFSFRIEAAMLIERCEWLVAEGWREAG